MASIDTVKHCREICAVLSDINGAWCFYCKKCGALSTWRNDIPDLVEPESVKWQNKTKG